MGCANFHPIAHQKNEPKTNPIQTQFYGKQTQNKANLKPDLPKCPPKSSTFITIFNPKTLYANYFPSLSANLNNFSCNNFSALYNNTL